jgi:hypothetical protein
MQDECELMDKKAQPSAGITSNTHGRDYVSNAVRDFNEAIELSLLVKPEPLPTESGEPVILDPKPWIKAKIMLAYARLRNNQVEEAIEDFRQSDNLDYN